MTSTRDDHIALINDSISQLVKSGLRICAKDVGYAGFMLKTLAWQNAAATRRAGWKSEGIHVPPFMIASITGRCNLNCKGCYARAQNRAPGAELPTQRWSQLFGEAHELGINIILLAGGEPLTRPDVIDAAIEYPQVIFPLFTNGMLLDDEMADKIRRSRNVIPVVSLEGHQEATDERRGAGVHDHVAATLERLSDRGVFYGTSITLTRNNFATVTGTGFIDGMLKLGCRLFFFVEYVPVAPGTEDMVLTDEQRAMVPGLMETMRNQQPGIFIAFPGDEDAFGGCLSAGRGFVHVSPQGSLEPCPFAPYSDTSVADKSLKEALNSDFLRTIRSHYLDLSETHGGCALWDKREWVQSLLRR